MAKNQMLRARVEKLILPFKQEPRVTPFAKIELFKDFPFYSPFYYKKEIKKTLDNF